jgi:hypothetical protein
LGIGNGANWGFSTVTWAAIPELGLQWKAAQTSAWMHSPPPLLQQL